MYGTKKYYLKYGYGWGAINLIIGTAFQLSGGHGWLSYMVGIGFIIYGHLKSWKATV